MQDRHTFTDHRYEAARATGCRQASERGYTIPEEPPYSLSGAAIVISICAVIAVALALVCSVS